MPLLANGLRRADPRPVDRAEDFQPAAAGTLRPSPGGVFRHFTRAVDGFAAMNAGLARETAGAAAGPHHRRPA